MAFKNLNAENAQEFIDRLQRIEADTPRKWGTMTAAEMCRHMCLSIEGGMGEVEFEDRQIPMVKLILPILFSPLVPFPKGRAKTAPEYVGNDAQEFETERDRLVDDIYRFVAQCDETPDYIAPHPLFGSLTVPQNQRGHGKHLDHHLRQFGV